jgi:hypothetical protein
VEYDFRIVFARQGGDGQVGQVCCFGEHQFNWVVGARRSTYCGFEMVGGKVFGQKNPTESKSTRWITNGEWNESIVKVRKTGVRAFLNGKLISQWKTNYTDMSLRDDTKLHSPNALGLNAWDSPTDFKTVEVIEITGAGNALR